MGDLLGIGATWLADQRTAHAAETIRYERPTTGEVLPEVLATPGRTEFELDEGDAGLQSFRSQDWLIEAELLDFGTGRERPAEGDRITVTRGGVDHLYEVLRIAGDSAWRWSDSYQQTYRIHTKLISH